MCIFGCRVLTKTMSLPASLAVITPDLALLYGALLPIAMKQNTNSRCMELPGSDRFCVSAVVAKASGKHTHNACFTLTEAGPFTVAVRLEGAQGCREYKNLCKPGPVSVPHCKVLSVDSCLTAGQTGKLRLQRRDM